MATGLSFVTYPISGTNYEVPFDKLRKEDVYVYRDGVLLTQGEDWSWVDDSNITLVDASGDFLEIRRKSSWTERLVNYTIPSSLNESDLNLDSKQAFYMGQEATDIEKRVIVRDSAGRLDMESQRIINLADAQASTDAVNKGQLDAVVVAAGNVPTPGDSGIGKFLKATAATVWEWVSFGWSELSSLLSDNAPDARAALGLGTAATGTIGTAPNNVVTLDGSGRYRAIDGSQITKLPADIGGSLTSEAGVVSTSSSFKVSSPFDFTATSVFASLNVAQTSGAALTVDVKKNGATILSTTITFTNGALYSTNGVISGSSVSFSVGDKIEFVVTQVGDGTAKGLKVVLSGSRT